jgi:hypothetical protein
MTADDLKRLRQEVAAASEGVDVVALIQNALHDLSEEQYEELMALFGGRA